MKNSDKPIVYACSGCSNVAQMANYMAVKMSRRNLAEMSCIAGVGGHVPKLVKIAKSKRKIIAIDGCPLQCVSGCLEQHKLKPDHHITLSDYGFIKNMKEDFDEETAEHMIDQLSHSLELS